MTTMTRTATKTAAKKPKTAKRVSSKESKAVIQVRVDARMKRTAEKIFRKQGLSTSDGVRRLLTRAIEEQDPWYAHKTSSHIPNEETMRVIEESEAGINMQVITLDDLQKQWDAL